MKDKSVRWVGSNVVALVGSIAVSHAQVVINEFQYDDTGTTDDREFVELFNAGILPVDIGNWVVAGRDTVTNVPVTIPAGTMLASGGFYVIGNAGVPTTNTVGLGQVVASGFLQNDNEVIELFDATATLVDAVAYEANLGLPFASGIAAQIGPGFWGNHQGTESGAPAGTTNTSVARYLDGRDTNNNGRDFGLRRGTPGAANSPGGEIINYTPQNVDAFGDGTTIPGFAGSFVNARVFTPGTVTPGLNLNAIPAPAGANKAIIAWDNSGGGNSVVSDAVFGDGGAFQLQVYFDTENMPPNTAGTTPFTGSEITFYGIGGGDAFTNLEDITGAVTLAAGTVAASGFTGVHWLYEKTSNGSEKLYLVDANDGGNSNADNALGLDWVILATIDLSSTPSGWHDLRLSIAPDGTGVGVFDTQVVNFNTLPGIVGSFSVGYRENTQDGSILVPTYLRPPTFAMPVPEPGVAALLALGALGLARRRR